MGDIHFGFSYVGFIYLIMLMVPDMIWTKNKPKDYEKYVGHIGIHLMHRREIEGKRNDL